MSLSYFNQNEKIQNKAVTGLGGWFGLNRDGQVCPTYPWLSGIRLQFSNRSVFIIHNRYTEERLYLYKNTSEGKLRVMSSEQVQKLRSHMSSSSTSFYISDL